MIAKIFIKQTQDGPVCVAREAFPISPGEFKAPADSVGRIAVFFQETAAKAGYKFQKGDIVKVYAAEKTEEGIEATVGNGTYDGINNSSIQRIIFKKAL